MEKMAIYRAPQYHNESAPRKQYVIKIGEIEWYDDVWGFKNKFIYETATDPYDFDDETKYGVSEEFYYELIETLSVDISEVWNEPEIISIKENN